MRKQKKVYLLGAILIMAIVSVCIIRTQIVSKAASTSWNFKDSDLKKLGKFTTTKTVNGLTMIATASKPLEVKQNKQTLDGTEYKYCLCLGGMGTTSYRSVKVPISGNSRIKITLMSNNSSSQRELVIADNKGNKLTTVTADKKLSLKTYDYCGSSDYVYLYSQNSGINIFKIQVDDKSSSDSSSDSSNDSSNVTAAPKTTASPSVTSTPKEESDTSNSGKTITITQTIKVAAGQTYDGKGAKIIAQGMGDGGQAEDQSPIFRLENGATLKNVVIGAPGCDGVHCYGNNTITNVVWEDVGEDALTVKGGASANAGTVTVNGGSAKYATDKMFQINAPCTFKLSNFNAYDMGKLVRQNGKTTFTINVYLDSVTADKVNCCLVMTDSTTSKIYYNNLKVTNCKKVWDVPNSSQVVEYGGSSEQSPRQ